MSPTRCLARGSAVSKRRSTRRGRSTASQRSAPGSARRSMSAPARCSAPPMSARAADAGAQFIVSPNTDAEVIRATKLRGLESMPGFFTASEALAAAAAGADALKLFPAEGRQPRSSQGAQSRAAARAADFRGGRRRPRRRWPIGSRPARRVLASAGRSTGLAIRRPRSGAGPPPWSLPSAGHVREPPAQPWRACPASV